MNTSTLAAVMTEEAFQAIAKVYRKNWRLELCVCLPDGRILQGRCPGGKKAIQPGHTARALAISEALRWGEPEVEHHPPHHLVWAVPLLYNHRLLGGLLAGVPEERVFAADSGDIAFDVQAACADLRRLAEEANLTNAALLEMRRAAYMRERKKAETIHDLKDDPQYDLRAMYLREEPALLAAIRKGDWPEARGVLNRLLVAMSHRAKGRLELEKSFFMELVITMCRTAVEVGGDAEELLGTNYANLTDLARIETEEQLAPWLTTRLDQIIESIHSHGRRSMPVLLSAALNYMNEHYGEDIGRDDVAEAVHVSPSHFSRQFKKYMGKGFNEVLNQMRVDKAAELLARTDRDLVLVAVDVGFRDQSYFTKVFRRYTGQTPRQYRLAKQAGE